ncbi:MAG: 23S rRNA (guanosine(2251)-2'-O)-methyltransferase RlmB [Coriobacteriia bacterium]|nr:23S rRNA (guanosine(2251)-2'-O)-methyltransferase RlmB [Coriobacteriia bacterium]MCL2136662.1 23S rRNA (guanosine(2251)-2'-O)-methyltransferase RlmB [Coriobacteriia bacterium]
MSDWRAQSKNINDAYQYQYATLFDLVASSRNKKNALIVALDHITDVGNFGAIIRSAEVVGATGVLIPNKRAAQVNETVYRTSAGAIEYIRVARETNIHHAVRQLKEEGFWIAGATEHASMDVWSAPLEGRIVLVLGSEDKGLSRLVREQCDFEFKLPQYGFTQSLNVAQAATAIMYEWRRRVVSESG